MRRHRQPTPSEWITIADNIAVLDVKNVEASEPVRRKVREMYTERTLPIEWKGEYWQSVEPILWRYPPFEGEPLPAADGGAGGGGGGGLGDHKDEKNVPASKVPPLLKKECNAAQKWNVTSDELNRHIAECM